MYTGKALRQFSLRPSDDQSIHSYLPCSVQDASNVSIWMLPILGCLVTLNQT